MRKKIYVGLTVVCGGLLILVIGLFLYAKTDHAKDQILKQVNEKLPGTLSIGKINFSISRSFIQIEDVEIRDPQDDVCLALKTLFFDFTLSSLLKRKLEINLLSLDHPRVQLARDAKGTINLLNALLGQGQLTPKKKYPAESKTTPMVNIIVDTAKIVDGIFLFKDEKDRLSAKHINIETTGVDLFKRILRLNGSLKEIHLGHEDKAIQIRDVRLLAKVAPDSELTFEFELGSDLLDFKSRGVVQNMLTLPEIDITVDSSVRLEHLTPLLERPVQLGGRVGIHGSGKGPVSNPTATLFLDAGGLALNNDFDQGAADLAIHLNDRVVTIDKGILSLLENQLTLSGSMDLKSLFPDGFLSGVKDPDQVTYDMSFKQAGGDFQNLDKWVKAMTGKFSSSGRIQGRGLNPDTLEAAYNLNLILDDVGQNKPGIGLLDLETRLAGRLSQGIFQMTQSRAVTDETILTATGRFDLVKKNIEASLEIDAPDLFAATAPLGHFPIKGAMNTRVDISGQITNPSVTARIQAKDLVSRGVSVQELALDTQLTSSGRVVLERFSLKDRDMKLDMAGSADIFDSGFKLKETISAAVLLSGEQINPRIILEKTDVSLDRNLLDSTINLNMDLGVDVALNNLATDKKLPEMDLPVTRIDADIDLEAKSLSLLMDKLVILKTVIDPAEKQYQAKATFHQSDFFPLLETAGIKGVALRADGEIEAEGHLPVDLPSDVIKNLTAATGKIALKADVKGRPEQPDFDVLMTLSNLNYDLGEVGIKIADVNGRIEATPENIFIKDLTLQINDGRIQMSGQAALDNYKVHDCRLKMAAERLIIPLPAESDKNKELRIDSFDADLGLVMQYDDTVGKDDKKKDLLKRRLPVKNLEANLDLTRTALAVRLDKTTDINASLDPARAFYQLNAGFDQTRLDSYLGFAGLVGVHGKLDGYIRTRGNLKDVLPEAAVDGLVKAGGNIQVNAVLSGPVDTPGLDADIVLSGVGYPAPGITLSDLSGKLNASNKQVRVDAIEATVNQGQVKMNANFLLDEYKVQGGELNLTAENLEIPLASETGSKESLRVDTFDSRLDFNLSHLSNQSKKTKALSEKLIPLARISADADLENLSIKALLDKTIDFYASFDPDQSLYGLDLKLDQTVLDHFFETAGLDTVKGKVNGYVKSNGKTNIGFPSDVIDGLKKATGKVSVEADLAGTFKKPEMDARINLSGVGYPVPLPGLAVSRLNGRIRASNSRIAIENLAADLGKGRMNLDGQIDLADHQPVKGNIQFRAENILIDIPDAAQLEFSSELTFSGTEEKSNLTGFVQLINGEYFKDFTFNLADAAGTKKRKTATPEKKEGKGSPFIENTVLNIDVDYKDPFILDNNLAFILIEPNVTVKGQISKPIVTGRARIIEGVVLYLKKEFEIEKGIVDFVDPYKTDPEINLAAISTIRDWVIHLEITGKTENLDFRLFSEPRETHEDILSLLITGKTTKELGKGDGSYTSMLTDMASDAISQGVEETTPLDSFKLGYDESDSEGLSVSVAMGKKLSKRMEVIYSMETEDEETVHTNSAEYRLLENLMIKAFNDSKGDFGTEFTFKMEFR